MHYQSHNYSFNYYADWFDWIGTGMVIEKITKGLSAWMLGIYIFSIVLQLENFSLGDSDSDSSHAC